MLKSLKKLIFIGYSTGGLFIAQTVLAQGLETTDLPLPKGVPDYAEVKTMFAYGIATMIIIAIIGLLFFAFWLWMIIHAASNPIENKAMWIVLLVLLGVLGAIIYYFAVKRSYDHLHPSISTAINTPTSSTPTAPATPS